MANKHMFVRLPGQATKRVECILVVCDAAVWDWTVEVNAPLHTRHRDSGGGCLHACKVEEAHNPARGHTTVRGEGRKVISWRHRTMPSGATRLACCFTSVALTRIRLPLQRGAASTCSCCCSCCRLRWDAAGIPHPWHREPRWQTPGPHWEWQGDAWQLQHRGTFAWQDQTRCAWPAEHTQAQPARPRC